jgi:hypothetical protein
MADHCDWKGYLVLAAEARSAARYRRILVIEDEIGCAYLGHAAPTAPLFNGIRYAPGALIAVIHRPTSLVVGHITKKGYPR